MQPEIKNLMTQIEKFVKGGRISFQLLEKKDSDKLQKRELCVEFDSSTGEPRIYIKNNLGEVVPIKSKAEDLIEEFLIKFIQISKNKKYNYNPSLWFKLINDTGGFTPENINAFYNYTVANFNTLTPYIQYVKTYEGEEKAMVPFVTTDAVYFNLGQLIQDKGITNVTTTLNELYSFIIEFKNNVVSLTDSMNKSLGDLINELKNDFAFVKNKFNENSNLLNGIDNKIQQILNKYNSISGDIAKNYIKKTITSANSGTRHIDITHGNNTGITVSGACKLKPSSPVIVVMENSSGSRVTIELGQNGYSTNTNGVTDEYVIRSDYRGGNQLIFNVQSIGNGWRLSVAGNTLVNVFSRGGDVHISDIGGGSHDANNVPPWNRSGVFTFSNKVLVTRGIVMGDYSLNIE